jgi:hypothetical protein
MHRTAVRDIEEPLASLLVRSLSSVISRVISSTLPSRVSQSVQSWTWILRCERRTCTHRRGRVLQLRVHAHGHGRQASSPIHRGRGPRRFRRRPEARPPSGHGGRWAICIVSPGLFYLNDRRGIAGHAFYLVVRRLRTSRPFVGMRPRAPTLTGC